MIWVILVLAFFLRVVALNQSLWLDEAINVLAAKSLSWFDFITKYPIGDFHPPGYFAFLWPLTRVFGFSEIAVRMPSVILGVATVYLTYLLGRELFNKKIAAVASLFLAVAPLHVYYSQEARMYSLAAFGVTLSSYLLLKLTEGKRWPIFVYGLGVALVLYSDYVAYLILPAHLIYVLFLKQKIWKKLILSWLLAFISFLPWMAVLPQQFLVGREASLALPGWKKVAGGANLQSLALVWVKTLIGRISFENKLIYGGLAGAMSILYGLGGIGVVRGIRKNLNPAHILLVTWIVVPLSLAFVISFFIPMLSYFRMVFILPAFYLLLAYGLVQLPKYVFRLLTVVLVVSSLVFLSIYYTNPKFQREDWRGAVNVIKSELDDNTAVIFESNTLFSPYVFYAGSTENVIAGLTRIPARSVGNVRNLEELHNKDKVFLFEYLVEITDPGRFLEKELENKGFKKSQVYDFSGVGFVTLYSRL